MADTQAVSLCEGDINALEQGAILVCAVGGMVTVRPDIQLELIRLARKGLKLEGRIDTLTGSLLNAKIKIDAAIAGITEVFGE